jgi:muramoyltetrapeptide carboxypeptidase
MKMKTLLLAGAIGFASLAMAAGSAKMKAILTVPHEFDMLLESGHIQGLACSETGIYLSHQQGLAKIDWNGKLVKHVDTPRHLGGIAYADGKIYGAFIIRKPSDMKDGKPGLVRVWDENLNQVDEKAFQEAAGCLGILGDTIYYAVSHAKKPHRDAKIKRLGLDLSERGEQTFEFGYEIKYGTQAIASDGKSLICANYGGVSLANPEFTAFRTLKTPNLAEGFALVPKSISKRERPVFMVVRAMGGNIKGWRKDPKNNPPRLCIGFYEFDGETFADITEAPNGSDDACTNVSERKSSRNSVDNDEDGVNVSSRKARSRARNLDFTGCFPKDTIKTIALVMPASIQTKECFDMGKAALEAAGYKVKVMPRLNFEKVAPVEDRVADFEQAWMDPEVDLVLCARGGRGSESLLDKLDWEKLRTRKQRVLGFSNITMILNAMLKEKAGRPYSGPTLSQFLYAKRSALEWLSQALAENAPMPDVKLRPIRAGECKGQACGGHVALVHKGVEMGWAADAKGRIVFLETSPWEPSSVRAMLDELVAKGYFKECAGVVFGDLAPSGPNRARLSGEKLKAGREEMEKIKTDFASKVSCPVYDGYPYGHMSLSRTIDFLREKTISEDGVMRQ